MSLLRPVPGRAPGVHYGHINSGGVLHLMALPTEVGISICRQMEAGSFLTWGPACTSLRVWFPFDDKSSYKLAFRPSSVGLAVLSDLRTDAGLSFVRVLASSCLGV